MLIFLCSRSNDERNSTADIWLSPQVKPAMDFGKSFFQTPVINLENLHRRVAIGVLFWTRA